MTIKEFIEMLDCEQTIEIYSYDDDVLGSWWSDEIPDIFDWYSVDSIGAYIPEGRDFPTIILNSDDCNIENLALDAEMYGFQYNEVDAENDITDRWATLCGEIYGGVRR